MLRTGKKTVAVLHQRMAENGELRPYTGFLAAGLSGPLTGLKLFINAHA